MGLQRHFLLYCPYCYAAAFAAGLQALDDTFIAKESENLHFYLQLNQLDTVAAQRVAAQ